MAETLKSRTVRVVQGLQEGAEFSLDPGLPCVIGSDASCTAVLLDENVAPRHCLLSIDDRIVRCTALDESVRIGTSKLEPGATARIFDYQTIEIGNASFAVRPADEDWEQGWPRRARCWRAFRRVAACAVQAVCWAARSWSSSDSPPASVWPTP